MAAYTVDSITSDSASPAARHTVAASRIAHGINGPEPVTERYVLSNLPAELLAVVAAQADKLPAYIRALDADTVQALRKHAQHVGRGYMAS